MEDFDQSDDATTAELGAAIPGFFPPPHGLDQVIQRYGYIELAKNGDLNPPSWEPHSMVKVWDLPLIGHPLYVNALVVPMLRYLLERWQAIGGYTLTHIGCFAPRLKRSNSSDLSLHSWGVAVDVNPDENPARRVEDVEPAELEKKIPDEWVDAAKSIGWTWGGDFVRWSDGKASGYYDPMHFQWASGY